MSTEINSLAILVGGVEIAEQPLASFDLVEQSLDGFNPVLADEDRAVSRRFVHITPSIFKNIIIPNRKGNRVRAMSGQINLP
jgi:hypothetical protein